jgi:hypothetical protein
MALCKSIIFAGNFAVSTGGAQTFTPALDAAGLSKLGSTVNEINSMDVLLNVKTFSGTKTVPSVQERFSDTGFVETANYGTTGITATGKYILAHDGQTGQSNTANIQYGFAMLGKGTDKQIVFTNTSISSISIDVYWIMYR